MSSDEGFSLLSGRRQNDMRRAPRTASVPRLGYFAFGRFIRRFIFEHGAIPRPTDPRFTNRIAQRICAE